MPFARATRTMRLAAFQFSVFCTLAVWLLPAGALGNPQPPANDNFLSSINLNSPGEPLNSVATLESSGETIGATVQSNIFSPCGITVCRTGPAEVSACNGVSYGKTVWYDFYPDHDGQIEIRTFGFPNVIALYTYNSDTLQPRELQCEPGSSDPSNDLSANVKRGVDYTYQIGGRGGAGGPYQMLFNFAYRTHLTVAPFRAQAVLKTVIGQPAERRLLQLRFIGLVRGEKLAYGCAFCGPGAFGAPVARGNIVVLTAASPPIVGPHTRLIIAAASPAQIGRFKLYGLVLNPQQPTLHLITQGCLAPGVRAVSAAAAQNPSLLHQVPCPTVLLNPAGAEYVFWQGSDDRLWEQWYSGTRWTRATHVSTRALGSSPSVAVHADGQQDVFWRGTHGDLWETWWTGRWNGPVDLGGGGQLGSAPSVGVDAAENEYAFWRGTDGGLREMIYSGGSWSQPVAVANSGTLGSGPAVAVHAGGQQDVFWRGTNGDLFEIWWTGRWNGPIDLAPAAHLAAGSAPSVGVDGSDNDYVFWQGSDEQLWKMSHSRSGWTKPQSVNAGRLGSGPTVAVHANGQQDVFWEGRNGDLWEAWFTGRWNGPKHLAARHLGSAPSAGVGAGGKQSR